MSLRKKRRTRQQIIAFQSTVHVEQFIAISGYTTERVVNDYGYDLVLFTYDDLGYIENGQIYIQMKASDSIPDIDLSQSFRFKVDIKDYCIGSVLVQRKLDKSTFLLRDFSCLRQEGFSGITKP